MADTRYQFSNSVANIYLLDKFLGKEYLQLDIGEKSGRRIASLVEHLAYSKHQPELHDFAEWLSRFATSDQFYNYAN